MVIALAIVATVSFAIALVDEVGKVRSTADTAEKKAIATQDMMTTMMENCEKMMNGMTSMMDNMGSMMNGMMPNSGLSDSGTANGMSQTEHESHHPKQ
ncbi:MAG: hypothetical protein AABX52_04695 [Nanoarchaeota archaeon]